MVNAIPSYFKSQWSLSGNFTLTPFLQRSLFSRKNVKLFPTVRRSKKYYPKYYSYDFKLKHFNTERF